MPVPDARIARMTWPEFAERIRSHAVLVPVGSVEQHGPHLPLGVDAFIPYHLALRLAERMPALVAPPVWYAGPSDPASGGGQRFPGTLALRGTTLIDLTTDILDEFFRQGARWTAIMNGHFENTAFLAEAARRILPPSDASGRKAVVVNWWEHVPDEALRRLFPEGFPGWEVEHASLTETSLMQALVPELVHVDRLPAEASRSRQAPKHKVFPEPSGIIPPSGILYTASGASAARGQTLTEVLLDALESVLRAEFSL
jgi:creatinine amidohydrolase